MADGLRIEYVALDDLRRWPRNPKEHDLGAIHLSIARFGYVNPIIINEATGLILAGHGRLDTLLQRQAARGPLPQGMRSDNGRWLVPVVRGVTLPSEEAEAYAIADNRTVELGGWDDAALAAVLQDLAESEGGLDGVGYDGDDLDVLLSELDVIEGESTFAGSERGNPSTGTAIVSIGRWIAMLNYDDVMEVEALVRNSFGVPDDGAVRFLEWLREGLS